MNRKEGLIVDFLIKIIILPIVLISSMTSELLSFYRLKQLTATLYYGGLILSLFLFVFFLILQYTSAREQIDPNEKRFVYTLLEPYIVFSLLSLLKELVKYIFVIYNYTNFNVYLAICTVILIIIVYFNMKYIHAIYEKFKKAGV